jgi:hypothetical protein
MILDIINCPVFYLKYHVSETGLCLRFQVDRAQVDRVDKDELRNVILNKRQDDVQYSEIWY